jgi:CheY-like chemotaxis protein
MDVSYFGRGRLVLVVDDHQDFCVAMEHLIGTLGFRVMCVPNGVEALKKIETHPVAVVVTDLFMPEMDGIELLRRLGNLKIDKPIPPIIAVTGDDHIAADSVGSAAAALGAIAVLMKPFSREQLAGALSFALSTARKLHSDKTS